MVEFVDFENYALSRVSQWRLTRCWLPKKCALSKKPLWGKNAYKGIWCIHGPGDPVEKTYWIEKKEFLFWQLKGQK